MDDRTRDRLYSAYATTHAGEANTKTTSLAFEREILPHLPPGKDLDIVDLGCGQGELVRQFHDRGYRRAVGIDISPEQVELARLAGIAGVRLGDYTKGLGDEAFDVVTATDFLEHLTRSEVLYALDAVVASLKTGGVLIARTPNLASPFGGNYRYGDITHETSFTARSLRQLGAAVGFERTEVFSCPPKVHGVKSAARLAVWKLVSGAMKTALAAETGQVRGHHVTQNIVAVMHR